jgi:hypothetical protein
MGRSPAERNQTSATVLSIPEIAGFYCLLIARCVEQQNARCVEQQQQQPFK